MRFLSILFCFVLSTTVLGGHRSHRSHIVNDDGHTRISIVRESDGDNWASYERDGVRYVTRESAVLGQIEKAMASQRDLSREHSRLGRRHSELGREHSQLRREHSRLARHASRAGDSAELERLERELEAKQRKLEERQRQLEEKQRELEAKQRVVEQRTNEAIEKIFERAVRDGKAKRD